jgi:hypothetical protein
MTIEVMVPRASRIDEAQQIAGHTAANMLADDLILRASLQGSLNTIVIVHVPNPGGNGTSWQVRWNGIPTQLPELFAVAFKAFLNNVR